MASNRIGRLAAVLLVAAAGCSKADPYGRLPISGEVRFHGEPIANGSIQFINQNGQRDFDGGSAVLDGRYDMPREFGLVPGTYRARLSLMQLVQGEAVKQAPPSGADPEAPGGKLQQVIPPPYSTDGVIVEVRAGEANRFDFDVP